MKKIGFVLLFTIISLISFGQIPRATPSGFQFGQIGLGSSNNLFYNINGVVYPRLGYAPALWADTATMNASTLNIKNIPLFQASTLDGKNWFRNIGLTAWIEIGSGSGGSGTVINVSALTLGTTGTDLSSTVANPTTTPVITLNVPTASASNRGALSAADWITFNAKGNGTVTSVSGLSPLFTVANATTTPTFSQISQSANLFYGGPTSGGAANPTFRALVAGDLPGIPLNTILAQTGNWVIGNGAFTGTLLYNTLVTGPALQLVSTSTAASSGQTLFKLSTSGTNVNSGQATYAAIVENQHDGPTSTNFGISIDVDQGTVGNTGISAVVASDGAVTSTDIGADFSLNTAGAASTSIGIRSSVIGGALTNTAGQFSATGAGTTNTAGRFTASGGTVNNAINITAGAMALNGSAGNSGQVFTSAGANTLPTWQTPSTVATAVPISGLTNSAATNGLTIGHAQTWTSSLTSGDALKLTSSTITSGNILNITSTGTAFNGGSLMSVTSSGVNASSDITVTGITTTINNTGSGSSVNYGVLSNVTGAATNYAGAFAANTTVTGTNVGLDVSAFNGSVANYAAKFRRGKVSMGTAGTETGILEINGGTSGTVGITTAAAAGTWTLTLPTNDGDADQVLKTDGAGVTSWTTAGGGSPGGSTTQLQYNNAGAFGGISGATSDGTNLFVPTLYGSSAANGDIIIKGTSSATKTTSYVTLQEDGGLVGVGTTTPLTTFHLNRTGVNTTPPFMITGTGSFSGGPTDATSGVGISLIYNTAGNRQFWIGNCEDGEGFRIIGNALDSWNNSTSTNTPLVLDQNKKGISIGDLSAVASAQVSITATATEQLRLRYDASNYASFTTSSAGVLTIAPSGASITITKPVVLKAYTVATLPAGVQGMVAYVTDALAPAFLATIVGGGAIVTPVFYNGSNWVAN